MGDTTATIESITVTCRAQEDWTGSDQIDLYLTNLHGKQEHLGSVSIGTGETKELSVGGVTAHYFDYIEAWERDIDPNDFIGQAIVADGQRYQEFESKPIFNSASYTFGVRFSEWTPWSSE
jgi:hypothetical protein